jgi:hypothetical protein
MNNQVNVEDLEAFRLFRAALLKFSQAANQSLANADAQIARVHQWLESEQTTFWQNQLRKRAEAVKLAKEAVRQKKLFKDSSGRTPSAVEEEKHLARCLAAVEHAEQKIETVRKWIPRLERAAEFYRGGISRLHATVDGDIPQAITLLDRLAATLEQYIQIEVPTPATPDTAAPPTPEESMARPADETTDTQTAVNSPAPPIENRQSQIENPQEPPHVHP